MKERHVRLASLAVRTALGICFTLHGLQKTFGLFGGPGLTSWCAFVSDQLGMSPGWLFGTATALGELLAGMALLLGMFSRLACLVVIGIMLGAILEVTGDNGYFIQDQGFEYNIAVITMAASLLLTGPGAAAVEIRRHREQG